MRDIVNILVVAVAYRFMQDGHADRYLGSKRVMILWVLAPYVPRYLRYKLVYMVIEHRKLLSDDCKLSARYLAVATSPSPTLTNTLVRFTSTSKVENITNVNRIF
jgi:hypothetical protein